MSSAVQVNLLILCSSWELRSTSAIERLLPRFRCDYAIVFRYRPDSLKTEEARLEGSNYHFIKGSLENAGVRVVTLVTELRSAELALKQLNRGILEIWGRVADLRVVIDISTFTKAHTLVFLRYLADSGKHNLLTVLFTDIVDPHEGEPSRGLETVVSLPLFGGAYKQGTDSMLFLFLGFEPDRIVGLWKRLEPNVTIPLFANRRDKKSPVDVKSYSNELLNWPGVMEPVEIPTAPVRAAGILAQLFAEHSDRFNLAMSATGSKLQCLGVYLALQFALAPMPVFYPIPNKYRHRYWNPHTYADVSLLMTLSPVISCEIIGNGGRQIEPEKTVAERYL